MVTIEYMNDYIKNIEHRVLTGRLPPEDMRIVKRYKEYKQQHEFKSVDFGKLSFCKIQGAAVFLWAQTESFLACDGAGA